MKKAFTLIELLVVISIISLLASLVLSSMTQARMKARNANVNQQVMEYAKALALYKLDRGHFPIVPADWSADYCLGGTSAVLSCGYGGDDNDDSTDLQAALITYIPSYPWIGGYSVELANGDTFKGAIYRCQDANCNRVQITYALEGKGQINVSNCARPANATSVTYTAPPDPLPHTYACRLVLD